MQIGDIIKLNQKYYAYKGIGIIIDKKLLIHIKYTVQWLDDNKVYNYFEENLIIYRKSNHLTRLVL